MRYKGIIFDLDGVLVSTDGCHYEAWKKLANEENIYFDRTINERMRGVSRMESLDIVLEKADKSYTQEEKVAMAERKNQYYIEKVKEITPKAILPGVENFISQVKAVDIKIAVGSSSKNTKLILKQVGFSEMFDAVADGNEIMHSKPAPDVFLLAAEKLHLQPKDCLVVEDAEAGVEAGLAAGMDVLAVGSAQAKEGAAYKAENLLEIAGEFVLKILSE